MTYEDHSGGGVDSGAVEEMVKFEGFLNVKQDLLKFEYG